MKKLYYITVILISVIFFGCEKSNIVEIPLPFEEDVVVQGRLITGQTFQGIRITKTIPVNETYDITKAEIKDAFVYLKINDVRVIPLHYTSDGIYMPVSNFYLSAGSTYELFGQANGRSFYSKTIIPQNVIVINSDYNSEGNYMEANVQVNPGEVYGGIWIIDRSAATSAVDFYSIVSQTNDDPDVLARTTVMPEKYSSPIYNERRFIQVYAFDKQFKPFFNSKDNNQPVGNYFIQGGGSIAWNVYGDHVIGLFIGIAISHL